MKYIKGEPKEEGIYLTINKYRYENKFTTPIVLRYAFVRTRRTGELVLENGKPQGCWVDFAGSGTTAEYYCKLPLEPKN